MNDLRKDISEILIKWNMPTRQVAISEIMQVIQQEKKALLEDVQQRLKTKIDQGLRYNAEGYSITIKLIDETFIEHIDSLAHSQEDREGKEDNE